MANSGPNTNGSQFLLFKNYCRRRNIRAIRISRLSKEIINSYKEKEHLGLILSYCFWTSL